MNRKKIIKETVRVVLTVLENIKNDDDRTKNSSDVEYFINWIRDNEMKIRITALVVVNGGGIDAMIQDAEEYIEADGETIN